jgi:23S rRNA (uracil1939-C5)-methyltransferase
VSDQIREIPIHQIGREGQGVGFDGEKNLYFVPGALPGDVVRVRFPSTQKRYRDAELVEVVNHSPQRRKPVCPHFLECGGCDWLHWEYEGQVRAKEEGLRHVMERANLSVPEWRPMRKATTTLGYRSRIQLRHEGTRLGFFKRRTHDIVDVDHCPVSHPKINAELARLRESLPPAGAMRKLELALNSQGEVERVWDSPHGFAGFTQVHPEQNEVLKSIVGEAISRGGSRRVLELYAGDGNLTFAYADLVDEVMAVEINSPSVDKARRQNKPAVRFLNEPVRPGLRRKLPRDFVDHYDTLLLDPPRSGADRSIRELIHPGLRNIIYVSCSALTFSQDAIPLVKRGFVLQRLEPIDMFPHTRHVELVAEFHSAS